jgi:hypothetical protein
MAVAFTAEEVERELAALNRSPGMQMPAAEPGRHCTPRMVQWGVLASGAGRLEACVVKIYDRAIAAKDNLRLDFLRKMGDCDIWVLYVRGKQLASNTDPTGSEAIAHGGVEDHADECAVAAKIFTGVVAEKIEKRKAEYAVIMKRIAAAGFGGKVGSPEMQQLVSQEIEAQRKRVMEASGSKPQDSADDDYTQRFPDSSKFFAGFTSSSDESSDGDAREGGAAATPASFQVRNDRDDADFDHEELSSSDSDSDSDSGSGSDSDDEHRRAPLPGMGTRVSCAHLPDSLDVQHHVHTIHKAEVPRDMAEYTCAVCHGRGFGGMVYECDICENWQAHLSCVLPKPTRERPMDVSMLMHETAVTQMFPASDLSVQAFVERAVLIMDGCNGQVRAAVGTLQNPGVLMTIFLPRGIDIIKGSAQCSPSQNPLDCMRSFMNVKRLALKFIWYLLLLTAGRCKPTWTWSTARASTEMKEYIRLSLRDTLKHTSPSDVNSFILSFMHLEQTLSQCFTMKTMQSGWGKAGLVGLELHKIMSHWIGWKDLSAQQVQGIKDLLPAFFHEVASTGILSDASMQSLQPFFPVDFHHYAVDRAALTTSRTRAQLMTVFQLVHRRNAIDAICIRVNAPEHEVRPDPPFKMDGNGKAVCKCGGRYLLLRLQCHCADGLITGTMTTTMNPGKSIARTRSTRTGCSYNKDDRTSWQRQLILFALPMNMSGSAKTQLCGFENSPSRCSFLILLLNILQASASTTATLRGSEAIRTAGCLPIWGSPRGRRFCCASFATRNCKKQQKTAATTRMHLIVACK